jgi:hypothetical protein
MAYVKTIAVLLFGLFLSTVVAAQTCDLNMGMTWSHADKVKVKMPPVEYKDLTPAQAGDIVKRSLAVIAEAQNAEEKNKAAKNKSGDYGYAFQFVGTNTCGIDMKPFDPVTGLTHKDSAKVWRQSFKVAEGTIKMSEWHASKGGKGPWGK